MIVAKVGLIVLLSTFVISESFVLNQLQKCGLNDNTCQQNLIQSVLSSISKTGLKELGIPPLDPLQLNNVSVSLFGLLDVGLEEGVVTGFKGCVLNSVSSDILNGRFSLDMICDLTIKGHYKAYSASPLIKSLLGGDFIRGDGFGKVKVEQIYVKINFRPFIFKNEDGEVFISTNINETTSDFEIIGNMRFSANNVLLGNEDVSQLVTELLNQYAKPLAPFFGKPFMDKSLEIVYSIGNKFFEVVPARFYIKEDLSPYIRNK